MYNMEKRLQRKICIIILGWLSIGLGAYLEDIPVALHQPDGTQINSFSSGNENYIRLHDAQNYTIIQSIHDGFYYYAQLENKKVIPTIYRADQLIPENTNLQPGVQITREEYLEKRDRYQNRGGRDAPTIGTVNNINIFIRFADEG